jgi:hypothetical protein
MIRQLVLAAVVALLTTLVTLQFAGNEASTQVSAAAGSDVVPAAQSTQQAALAKPGFVVTPKYSEDAWLAGIGADGKPRPGPADDLKSLAPAENTVCFLTDMEIQHVSDPGDQLACRVTVDEFTGFWELHAIQGDGTDASVRCNAMCLSW